MKKVTVTENYKVGDILKLPMSRLCDHENNETLQCCEILQCSREPMVVLKKEGFRTKYFDKPYLDFLIYQGYASIVVD